MKPVPLSKSLPIQYRQVVRASLSRFLDSRFHLGLIALDLILLIFQPYDRLGILKIEAVHLILVGILVYELALLLFNLLYYVLYYRSYFYDFCRSGVVVKRGVFCRKELIVPFNRITDIYVEQDAVSRFLGLYDVHLATQTEHSKKIAHMGGVNKPGAQSLYRLLLQHIDGSIKFSAESASY